MPPAAATTESLEKTVPQLFPEDRLDAWFDGSAICVVAVGTHGDPLDLGEEEVRALIAKLEVCLAQAKGVDQ